VVCVRKGSGSKKGSDAGSSSPFASSSMLKSKLNFRPPSPSSDGPRPRFLSVLSKSGKGEKPVIELPSVWLLERSRLERKSSSNACAAVEGWYEEEEGARSWLGAFCTGAKPGGGVCTDAFVVDGSGMPGGGPARVALVDICSSRGELAESATEDPWSDSAAGVDARAMACTAGLLGLDPPAACVRPGATADDGRFVRSLSLSRRTTGVDSLVVVVFVVLWRAVVVVVA
jgi:hypothetical protein